MSERTFKLQDLVGHTESTTCLAIGPRSMRVLVSGSKDQTAKVWRIGSSQCCLTLHGHSLGLEKVCFDPSEELVAGSASGSLKLWDLHHGKVVRTFESHSLPATSMEFHPMTGLLASGCSEAGVVKLWDVRTKDCVQEFSEGIQQFRFSPHGKWILSSDAAGSLQVRDLASRSLIGQIDCGADAQLSQMEFHPKELLVAASTVRGDVKLLDLNRFRVQSNYSPMSSRDSSRSATAHMLRFAPSGNCLFVASKYGINVLRDWERHDMSLFDSIEASWLCPTPSTTATTMHQTTSTPCVEFGALAAPSDTKLILGVSEEHRIGIWVATVKKSLQVVAATITPAERSRTASNSPSVQRRSRTTTGSDENAHTLNTSSKVVDRLSTSKQVGSAERPRRSNSALTGGITTTNTATATSIACSTTAGKSSRNQRRSRLTNTSSKTRDDTPATNAATVSGTNTMPTNVSFPSTTSQATSTTSCSTTVSNTSSSTTTPIEQYRSAHDISLQDFLWGDELSSNDANGLISIFEDGHERMCNILSMRLRMEKRKKARKQRRSKRS